MSSGVEADIALDAAVILTLGMNRVLGKAAGASGRGAKALAALAQAKAANKDAALAEAEQYDRALRDVIDRNARIAALAEMQGVTEPLPAPLPPGDHSAEELAAWCAATDEALREAEKRISAHLARQATVQIFPTAQLHSAANSPADSSVADAPATTDAQAEARADLLKTLERVLGRLAPDASERDREYVLEAVRQMADAPTTGEAEGFLTEVRLRVQSANHRTERRREEARRRQAEQEAREQAAAERRYVLDSVTAAFREMGYEVDTGFETLTARDATVMLTKGTWADHSVRMRVDDASQLRAAMVRTRAAQSEDDRRLDAEREAEWCAAFEAARDRLAAAGIASTVTWRIDPGEQVLPVASGARQTRTRGQQREYRQEREVE